MNFDIHGLSQKIINKYDFVLIYDGSPDGLDEIEHISNGYKYYEISDISKLKGKFIKIVKKTLQYDGKYVENIKKNLNNISVLANYLESIQDTKLLLYYAFIDNILSSSKDQNTLATQINNKKKIYTELDNSILKLSNIKGDVVNINICNEYADIFTVIVEREHMAIVELSVFAFCKYKKGDLDWKTWREERKINSLYDLVKTYYEFKRIENILSFEGKTNLLMKILPNIIKYLNSNISFDSFASHSIMSLYFFNLVDDNIKNIILIYVDKIMVNLNYSKLLYTKQDMEEGKNEYRTFIQNIKGEHDIKRLYSEDVTVFRRIANKNTMNRSKALFLFNNLDYLGHIFVWDMKNRISGENGLVHFRGIRESLFNRYSKHRIPKVSYKLIYGIINIANRIKQTKYLNQIYIGTSVIPIGPMLRILTKCGFMNYNLLNDSVFDEIRDQIRDEISDQNYYINIDNINNICKSKETILFKNLC